MNTGKLVRLNRLFSHPSGNFFSVAIDHFIGYPEKMSPGLRDIRTTLAEIVSGKPDAITMHKGIAQSCWSPFAGKMPFILQSMISRPDDSARESLAFPEDAIRLGADAIAVAIFVHGESEASQIRLLADMVRLASGFELPVICHTYPRKLNGEMSISFETDDIAWAVRCAVEAGADVIKTPFSGDVPAFSQVVNDCPVPLVIAGGPKANSLESSLEMVHNAILSGARGATIGRNVWGFSNIQRACEAYKRVIHDQRSLDEVYAILPRE